MSSEDLAIRVADLNKHYQVYERPQDRLKQALLPRLQRTLGLRVRRYCRDFAALEDISFEVRRGETVGIIGRNGAGKSTLLQILCGTLAASGGVVETRGRVAALLELGSGFNPEFTGRENVYLNASVLGLSRQSIEDRYNQIVAFADIGDFLDQPVKTYSSGMVMRLAFAVVAHVDADVLIIDEALSVGDAYFTQKCMRFLRKFMERGTVIFVSHDTGAVVNLCQRAVWLEAGRIRAIGEPRQLMDEYLADYYRQMQGDDSATPTSASADGSEPIDYRDARLDFINESPLRNDLQIFEFKPDNAAFGRGGAQVVQALLKDVHGTPLSWCVGGESVVLHLRVRAQTEINGPIVGFLVKDRLGQYLFGDNTYIACIDRPLRLPAGRFLDATFRFRMPVLPKGDYSFDVAIAEGSHTEHVQHHWIHDALTLRSHSSSVVTGLIGVPMREISLRIAE